MKKLLLIGTILLAAGCSPRRDEVCPTSTLAMCEPAVYFEFDSDVLDPKNDANLDWVAKKLADWPNRVVILTGHSDLIGVEDYNMSLSGRRSIAIKKALMERGVAENRIRLEAKGMIDPLTTEEERQELNRRVDVTFKNRNRSILKAYNDFCDEYCNPSKKEEVKKCPKKQAEEEAKAKAQAAQGEVKQDAKDLKNDVQADVKSVKEDVKKDASKVQQ